MNGTVLDIALFTQPFCSISSGCMQIGNTFRINKLHPLSQPVRAASSPKGGAEGASSRECLIP